MTRIAIIAAMPGELKPLVRRWEHTRRDGVDVWRWRFDEGEWVAACAGAGQAAAVRAFAEAELEGEISSVISTGWVGALGARWEPGQVYRASGVIDAKTGERFGVTAWSEECWLVTAAAVADGAEKQRLAAAYGAALVDMEAAAVARLAAQRGIPFYAIKGVSDGFNDRLPDFNRFMTDDGDFKLARFVGFAVVRPWMWPALKRMGENSKRAAEGMAAALLDFLDERGYTRERNGYPKFKR